MVTVEEALSAILARAKPLERESVPLALALGRVLADEVAADIDLPPFDNSAVDGYAVRAEETARATPASPVRLSPLTDLPAGADPRERIVSGTAARIMTGAPIPPGADAIVMVEDTLIGPDGRVAIHAAAQVGQHLRRAGEDVRRGSRVLEAGTLVRAAEVAMLAAVGRAQVTVVRTPRVAVISTGDEVLEVEQCVILPPGKIRNSNRPALAALVREAGAVLQSEQHLPDDLDAITEALRTCADPVTGADVIVTAGGVSMGDRDYVKPALERLGELALWKVAMKPGKPLAFGVIGETLFFGLPGNPVSAFVTFELFVRPTLWKLAGRIDLERLTVRGIVTDAVHHLPGRREYVRANTLLREGRFEARPTGAQGSGILSSLIGANSLIVIPSEAEDLGAGEPVTILLL